MTTNPDPDGFLFGPPGGPGRYPYVGDPQGLDWVPNNLCLAAGEFFGSPITMGTREMRDWGLRTYSLWLDKGKPRLTNGKPLPWWMVADEDDIITRRALAELRESRAAQDDPSAPKRPAVTPTPAPKAPAAASEASEAQASRFSRLLNLPKHNPLRRSQTAVGSRERAARARERKADLARQEQDS